MNEKHDHGLSTDEVQCEMRAQQKFSIACAIGRAGSGLLKGESPVSQQEQASMMLAQWIDQNASDSSGALKCVLQCRVRGDEVLVAHHLKQPLNALRVVIDTILSSDYALREFVRQVDMQWGELYQERPLFQCAGQPPDPADEYTHESVRQVLILLLEKIKAGR